MKKINFMIVRKRMFLFILLGLATFMMNLFLWNETSQLIRNIPQLVNLKEKSSEDVYEMSYIPNSEENGLMKPYSEKEKNDIYELLENSFFDSQGESHIYLGKQQYINDSDAKNAKSRLVPMTKEMLKEEIKAEDVNAMAMNDSLIFDMNQNELGTIEKEAKNLNFSIGIQSLSERFQSEFNYYFGNFLFGLIVSLVFMSFGLFLIYWLISSSLKIFRQDIQLLRIVGLSNKKIIKNFNILLTLPIDIFALLFLVFAYSLGFGVLFSDYLYLLLLNASLLLFSRAIIKKKIRGMLNA